MPQIKEKTITILTTAAVFLLTAQAAHSDEAGCIAARYSAAGKYEGCEAKAAAKGFDEAALMKCRQKYAAAWTKLGTKYPGTSCVGARFTDNGSTITDNLTQLVWEKKTTAIGSGINASDRHDVDNLYTWSAGGTAADGTAYTDFLDDLNGSGFAGQHDWRLPTLFELHTIVSTDAVSCGSGLCIVDPLFAPTQSVSYWSSTTTQDGPSYAWDVYFANGVTGANGKTNFIYVRAVRAGS